MSVNKAILVGRLGKDPETRYTSGGQAVCNFSLATDETYKDRSGERQKRSTTEIVATNFRMLGGRGDNAGAGSNAGAHADVEGVSPTAAEDSHLPEVSDEDIPF